MSDNLALVSPVTLAEAFKVSVDVVEQALEGQTPAYSGTMNGVKIRLYTTGVAEREVTAHLNNLAQTRAEEQAKTAHFRPLFDAFNAVDERIEVVASEVEKLAQQNLAIFKLVSRLAALLDPPPPSPPAVAPIPEPAPTPEPERTTTTYRPKPPKHNPEPTQEPREAGRRVLIIGLLQSQSEVIQKEFGNCFKLKFMLTQDARGRDFINACRFVDVVITMVRFIDHANSDAVKAAGVRLVMVNGGMSALKDKLTEMFVNAHNFFSATA